MPIQLAIAELPTQSRHKMPDRNDRRSQDERQFQADAGNAGNRRIAMSRLVP
jgi:hypothetical protein